MAGCRRNAIIHTVSRLDPAWEGYVRTFITGNDAAAHSVAAGRAGGAGRIDYAGSFSFSLWCCVEAITASYLHMRKRMRGINHGGKKFSAGGLSLCGALATGRALLGAIDSPPALRTPAATGYLLDIRREAVINRQLLTRLNLPVAAIVNAAVDDPLAEIGVAGMIEIFGAAASHRPVQTPIFIEFI